MSVRMAALGPSLRRLLSEVRAKGGLRPGHSCPYAPNETTTHQAAVRPGKPGSNSWSTQVKKPPLLLLVPKLSDSPCSFWGLCDGQELRSEGACSFPSPWAGGPQAGRGGTGSPPAHRGAALSCPPECQSAVQAKMRTGVWRPTSWPISQEARTKVRARPSPRPSAPKLYRLVGIMSPLPRWPSPGQQPGWKALGLGPSTHQLCSLGQAPEPL